MIEAAVAPNIADEAPAVHSSTMLSASWAMTRRDTVSGCTVPPPTPALKAPPTPLRPCTGFKPVRVLYKMVLPLDAQTREDLCGTPDARTLPENLRMRTFTSVDEFLATRERCSVCAPPEQGKLTLLICASAPAPPGFVPGFLHRLRGG